MDGGSAGIASLHGCNLLGNAGAIAEEKISVGSSLGVKKTAQQVNAAQLISFD